MSPPENECKARHTTDEDLQAIAVGKVIPHNAPITLAEYDPEWPALFDREAARIRMVLGDIAVRVEHVGSTACTRPGRRESSAWTVRTIRKHIIHEEP